MIMVLSQKKKKRKRKFRPHSSIWLRSTGLRIFLLESLFWRIFLIYKIGYIGLKEHTRVHGSYTRAAKDKIKTKKAIYKKQEPFPYMAPNQLTKSIINIVASLNPTLTHSQSKCKKECFSI